MILDRRSFLAAIAIGAGARQARAAEGRKLTLGMLHTLSPAPIYIAQGRGYFTDQGLDVTFVFFDAAQPIAAAAVAGDIDVGITALTGGFFNLAEKGALRVIDSGLKPGERVIVDGMLRAVPGQKVDPLPAPPASAPAG